MGVADRKLLAQLSFEGLNIDSNSHYRHAAFTGGVRRPADFYSSTTKAS